MSMLHRFSVSTVVQFVVNTTVLRVKFCQNNVKCFSEVYKLKALTQLWIFEVFSL